ncbi:MAG: hypothetical protein WA384_09320 [Rhodomicrobium sp.]
MRSIRNIAAFAACLAMFSAPLAAQAQSSHKHYRHSIRHAAGCPVHRIADGSLVDCRGWRLWSGSLGWDNSCFHLDYLPSEFACSASGGRW